MKLYRDARLHNDSDMGDSAEGGVSKSAVKNAKTDAGKAAKKKPDPKGLDLIKQADEASAAKNLELALKLYKEAEEVCKASTMDAVAKEKKPKAPAAETKNPAADAAAEVCAAHAHTLPSLTRDNKIIRMLRKSPRVSC